jgi:hypothetical protein
MLVPWLGLVFFFYIYRHIGALWKTFFFPRTRPLTRFSLRGSFNCLQRIPHLQREKRSRGGDRARDPLKDWASPNWQLLPYLLQSLLLSCFLLEAICWSPVGFHQRHSGSPVFPNRTRHQDWKARWIQVRRGDWRAKANWQGSSVRREEECPWSCLLSETRSQRWYAMMSKGTAELGAN